MEKVRIGGRSYSDPDVIALIRAGGGLADPRSLVLTQATRLNKLYKAFDTSGVGPRDRLEHLASLVGLEITPMSLERRKEEKRDAVLLLQTEGKGKKGQVYYNPDRPTGRVNFSIGHEIGHTFFPPTSGGPRFREMCESDSREARELEQLCDLAAAELLMPCDEFRNEVGIECSISKVQQLMGRFGSSFEATVFRLASAHVGIAAAGLLRFRRRKQEQRAFESQALDTKQQLLFPGNNVRKNQVVKPKYRRQSFHSSFSFPADLIMRWNKSLDATSVVYQAATNPSLLRAEEPLPSDPDVMGTLEVIQAPYQRPDADPGHPDLLFLWLARD